MVELTHELSISERLLTLTPRLLVFGATGFSILVLFFPDLVTEQIISLNLFTILKLLFYALVSILLVFLYLHLSQLNQARNKSLNLGLFLIVAGLFLLVSLGLSLTFGAPTDPLWVVVSVLIIGVGILFETTRYDELLTTWVIMHPFLTLRIFTSLSLAIICFYLQVVWWMWFCLLLPWSDYLFQLLAKLAKLLGRLVLFVFKVVKTIVVTIIKLLVGSGKWVGRSSYLFGVKTRLWVAVRRPLWAEMIEPAFLGLALGLLLFGLVNNTTNPFILVFYVVSGVFIFFMTRYFLIREQSRLYDTIYNIQKIATWVEWEDRGGKLSNRDVITILSQIHRYDPSDGQTPDWLNRWNITLILITVGCWTGLASKITNLRVTLDFLLLIVVFLLFLFSTSLLVRYHQPLYQYSVLITKTIARGLYFVLRSSWELIVQLINVIAENWRPLSKILLTLLSTLLIINGLFLVIQNDLLGLIPLLSGILLLHLMWWSVLTTFYRSFVGFLGHLITSIVNIFFDVTRFIGSSVARTGKYVVKNWRSLLRKITIVIMLLCFLGSPLLFLLNEPPLALSLLILGVTLLHLLYFATMVRFYLQIQRKVVVGAKWGFHALVEHLVILFRILLTFMSIVGIVLGLEYDPPVQWVIWGISFVILYLLWFKFWNRLGKHVLLFFWNSVSFVWYFIRVLLVRIVNEFIIWFSLVSGFCLLILSVILVFSAITDPSGEWSRVFFDINWLFVFQIINNRLLLGLFALAFSIFGIVLFKVVIERRDRLTLKLITKPMDKPMWRKL